MDNPVEHCHRRGRPSDWEKLPSSKSLFCSPSGCGLPIGNLTSQLFSNVYLDLFDKYLVSLTGEGRYGRYVDDAYVVGENKESLRRIIPLAESFLQKELGLSLSPNKIAIFSAYRGVEFLGAYLKPFRRYVGNKCLNRMEGKMARWEAHPPEHPNQSINSYLGITSHYRAYNIRRRWLCGLLCSSTKTGYYTAHLLKYKSRKRFAKV